MECSEKAPFFSRVVRVREFNVECCGGVCNNLGVCGEIFRLEKRHLRF